MPSSLDDRPLSSRSAAFRHILSFLPADAAAALAGQVETCIDPERVKHYLPEFQSRFPEHFSQLAANRVRFEWLLAIFSHSRFLSEEVLQHPEWIADVPDVYRVLGVADYLNRLASYLTRPGSAGPHALSFALFRRREIFRIVLRDALSLASLSEITEELSNLAEAILQEALHTILREVIERHGAPGGSSPDDPYAGFCVLALGKLGGRELNYSSDIDLMFLYSVNGETSGANPITNREFYRKVANRYTELLSTYTPEGLCYRVDLRLRPEGKLGELCISLEGSKQYYKRRARDWELQMLIKARVVAGNEPIGREMLESVEASIYSTTTDFSTIETMSATRERLAEKLSSKRLLRNDLDVKLTRGGIRDIEFLVQCLQRLHGGRQLWVRHGGTLLALSRLLDRDLLSGTEYSRLVSAYEFLRHVEHRLQFEDDRQTHTLPSDAFELDRLARRMPAAIRPNPDGARPGTLLLRDLNVHLENVQVIYDRIVHAQRPLSYGDIHPAPVERTELSSPAVEPQKTSAEEPAQSGAEPALPEALLATLQRTAPQLADHLHDFGRFRNRAALQQFLENLIDSPQWLREVNSNPVLSSYLTRIFDLSPYLAEQLTRDVSLVEEVCEVVDHPNRRSAFEGLATPLNDLGALRGFFRREMTRIQTASLCLSEPVFQTLDRTSALAEFVIARAYRIALERALDHARATSSADAPFSEPHHEMMVVALGRLGMREFDLASDADLLFIIPNSEVEHQKFWTRVTEHIIEILTTYAGDRAILSIDTRLRPNGREGLLVQTESKYRDYFSSHSEAWEGIALMKARAVAGDVERATVFLTELQEADWRRWGQSGRSRQDLKQMRLRLEREQGGTNPLKAGPGGYYDADFALMYLRLKGAGLFFKTLNTPERIDIVEKMGHLERADAEFLLRATTFYRALDHGIRLATGQAHGKIPSSGRELDALTELVDLWTGRYPRTEPLEKEFAQMRHAMRDLFDRLFG